MTDQVDPVRTLAALAAFAQAERGPTTASVHLQLNIGGVAVWVCAACCAVVLVLAWLIRDDVGDARQQLREHGHQLNAIYRVAPSVEREVRARLEEDARLRAQASE